MSTSVKSNTKMEWGPRIDLTQVSDVFAPQTVPEFTPPHPGIDNLGISSTDTFMIPGKGEVTVDFKGYVRVARSQPTTSDWVTSEVYTNLIEMRMYGESEQTGPIIVRLNPDCLSTGMLRTPWADMSCAQPEKACRMAVSAVFDLPNLGVKLFNKEPILLTIDNVRAIPPAGNPGQGQIYQLLPLYNVNDPDGAPASYITALKFAMGTYLTKEELEMLQD
jgi:hypothetical protein